MHTFDRWKDALVAAQTVADVVRVMSEYIATLSQRDLTGLPAPCRDALRVDDIPGSALLCVREELHYRGDPAIAAMLHEIAHTFVAAANRIVLIQGREQPLPG